ncbi:DUF2800 domain-containing protein [Proteinivorax tanatarense]|uniref:DUF2800 domain-containing protein n=1 Tax=Proteinivorax tanatarense TaxID=1260629 RepID=A0AAU7VK66_9FIRM
MAAHALLSASGAHRWLHCSPSVRLEEEIEDTTSPYAMEGTFMHGLSELYLHHHLGHIQKAAFKKNLKQMHKSEFYSEEIQTAVDEYVAAVVERINEARSSCKDPLILIEERLDYSPWVREGFGTGDVVIVTDDVLEVIDLKGGKGVAVSAVGNPQARLYALGAINTFGVLYDIKAVRMTIIQPRLDNISTDEMEAKDLIKWAEEVVRPRAEAAFKGEGDFKPGEHCRFCKVKATCRARHDENMRLACMDFKEPALLTDEEITEVLLQAQEFKKWATDVESYAFEKARCGKTWPGMKLVEGRATRKYTSEKEVAEKLLNAGYPEERIYSKSLLSLTKLEKELGKKEFSQIIGDLIKKPPGKLRLVPEDDKRPAVKSSAEIDFKNNL